MKRLVTFILFLFAMIYYVFSQTDCPGLKNPIDFSLYSQYKGQLGYKDTIPPNVATGYPGLTFIGQVLSNTELPLGTSVDCRYGRFRIMSASEGYDPNTNSQLPVVPSGFDKSIRVGNCAYASDFVHSSEGEALFYDLYVTPNSTLLYLYFAIVVQAPGHGIGSDPSFVLRVTADTSVPPSGIYLPNQIYHDTSCYMIPSTYAEEGVDGWHRYTPPNSSVSVMYRDWTMCCVNLYEYLYRHVRIEVIISDCHAGVHYGYCYFAGDCGPMTTTVNGCNTGNSDTVGFAKAPSRMQAYQWYRSNIGVTTSIDYNDYTLIPNATDSVLAVYLEDFMSQDGADTLMHRNTFLCKMTTYLDPAKPLYSEVLATVGNMKPILYLDTFPDCQQGITLEDRSRVVYDAGLPANQVDTSRTEWAFYEGVEPTGMPVHVSRGGRAHHTYSTAGWHSALVRTFSYRTDTLCWNEKPVRIRALDFSPVSIALSRQDICAGDSVELHNLTPDASWHHWVLRQDGNALADEVTHDSLLPAQPYYKNTHVTLYTHIPHLAYSDTNGDGVLDPHYCISSGDTTIRVYDNPLIMIDGDTVVCNGTPATLLAIALQHDSSVMDGCTYAWYKAWHDSIPIVEGDHLSCNIESDTIFYIAVTSGMGCVTRDSVVLHFVDPLLIPEKTLVCTGDTVRLWGEGADSYTWSSQPADTSLWGQEHNDTIVVVPQYSTTYTFVAHANSGCDAAPISKRVTTQDYPVPMVEIAPPYIDSENPLVQFTDVSSGSAASFWNLGNGEIYETCCLAHTFLYLDAGNHHLVSLRTCNLLGCCSDTSFYLPISNFRVWFPNVFTPRLETNNTFHAHTKNTLVDYEIFIYNRRGTLVFHSVNPREGWDGFCNGEPCPQDSYVYIATYRRDDGSTRVLSQKGTVTLLR